MAPVEFREKSRIAETSQAVSKWCDLVHCFIFSDYIASTVEERSGKRTTRSRQEWAKVFSLLASIIILLSRPIYRFFSSKHCWLVCGGMTKRDAPASKRARLVWEKDILNRDASTDHGYDNDDDALMVRPGRQRRRRAGHLAKTDNKWIHLSGKGGTPRILLLDGGTSELSLRRHHYEPPTVGRPSACALTVSTDSQCRQKAKYRFVTSSDVHQGSFRGDVFRRPNPTRSTRNPVSQWIDAIYI